MTPEYYADSDVDFLVYLEFHFIDCISKFERAHPFINGIPYFRSKASPISF